jgi:hypothetical protein
MQVTTNVLEENSASTFTAEMSRVRMQTNYTFKVASMVVILNMGEGHDTEACPCQTKKSCSGRISEQGIIKNNPFKGH